MTRLILLGAGKIGETITHFLQASGDYTLTVADQDEGRLAPMAALGAATVRCEFGAYRGRAQCSHRRQARRVLVGDGQRVIA